MSPGGRFLPCHFQSGHFSFGSASRVSSRGRNPSRAKVRSLSESLAKCDRVIYLDDSPRFRVRAFESRSARAVFRFARNTRVTFSFSPALRQSDAVSTRFRVGSVFNLSATMMTPEPRHPRGQATRKRKNLKEAPPRKRKIARFPSREKRNPAHRHANATAARFRL